MKAGIMTSLACSAMKTESGAILGSVDLGVGSSNKGLSVTVGKSLRTLTCKCRGDVGVDGHLVIGDLSGKFERRLEVKMLAYHATKRFPLMSSPAGVCFH